VGFEMKVVFVRKTRMGTFVSSLNSLNFALFEAVGNNVIRWLTFQSMPNETEPPKMSLELHYTTKAEFNLEFDETMATKFITQSIS